MSTTLRAGNLVIADGIDGSSVVAGPVVLDGTALADIVSAIGALGIAVHDRSTKQHNIELTVVREHGTAMLAEKHVFGIRQEIPAKSTFDYRRTYGTGLIRRFKATEAHWQSVRAEAVGATSIVTYRITTGVIVPTILADPEDETTETPEAVDVLRDPLLSGSYGPTPGIITFAPPWHPGVHANAAITSITLADMAA